MKNVPTWAGLHVGLQGRAGGGRGTTEHEKNATHRVFFMSWGGGGAGEGREAAEHKERTHMGTFFVFGCRRTALARKSCWGQGLGYESR